MKMLIKVKNSFNIQSTKYVSDVLTLNQIIWLMKNFSILSGEIIDAKFCSLIAFSILRYELVIKNTNEVSFII